jgi:hypothetical protein
MPRLICLALAPVGYVAGLLFAALMILSRHPDDDRGGDSDGWEL